MAAPADGNDIIIKGGSAEIEFDPTRYTRDPNDPKKNKNSKLNIKNIKISGDFSLNQAFPNGFRGKITITCEE